MKIKSCAWLVCLILCLPIMMKAQVLKIENGMAFSSLVNKVRTFLISLCHRTNVYRIGLFGSGLVCIVK